MTHNQLRWEDALWSAGYRVTRQRAIILDAVCAGSGHTPLSEIYGRVRQLDTSIDRSTIYRALRLFVEVGIVVAADTGGVETVYEIAKPAPHHHLVCRSCGQEREIDHTALQSMSEHVLNRHGFQVATDHLVLFGVCSGCRERASEN